MIIYYDDVIYSIRVLCMHELGLYTPSHANMNNIIYNNADV